MSALLLLVFLHSSSLAATVASASSAEISPVAREIVAAGGLRTQSQRLAKLYQQAAQGLDAAAATRQISQASADVDSELGRLERVARMPGIQRIHGRCVTLWRELRSLLRAVPERAAVERVNQLADELMIASGKLVMQVEAEAESPVGRLVDQSARLNMLSQRLARLYLQAYAGDRSQGVLTDIEQARREFATGLRELEAAPENTPASRDAITLAKSQWVFFDIAIAQLNPASRGDGKAARNVVSSSERIAQMLDAASRQYALDYRDGPRGYRP